MVYLENCRRNQVDKAYMYIVKYHKKGLCSTICNFVINLRKKNADNLQVFGTCTNIL